MKSIFYFLSTFLFVILFISFNDAKKDKNAGNEEKCGLDGGKDCGEKDKKKDDEYGDKTEEEIKEIKKNMEKNKNKYPLTDEEIEESLMQEQTEEQAYRKGSACSYCSYCKFCKLCDKDCPCEKSVSKPNCDMCKYCKYCYLCKACDTVCQPGGMVDRFSAYISNNLPNLNKEDVDKDLSKVKDYVENYKEEL